jgi:chitinase
MSRYLTARRTGLTLLVSCTLAAVGCLAGAGPDGDPAASDDSGLTAAQCAGAAAWAAGKAYSTGALVQYQGKTYSCLQAHTSLADWTPSAVPALWHEETCAGGSSGSTAASSSSATTGSSSSGSGGGACNSSPWHQGTQYHTGDIVTFNGSLYIATHDNPGYDPTISTWFWSPYAGCTGGSGATTGSGGGACNYPQWHQGTSYIAGDIVIFNGSPYIATHDNPGYDPTISTWFWSPYAGCSGGGSGSGGAGGAGGSGSTSSSSSSSSGSGGAGGGGGQGGKLFVGYYQTWSDSWKANGADTVLAKLPAYVNVVNLSFAQPNMSYSAGSLSLGGTGIGVPYDGPTLKAAVTALHQKNPGTRVMLSVGGATFPNFGSFNTGAIAAFVKDFGLDGVDIDYEPSNPNCSSSGGQVSCPSDAEYVSVVKSMRAALPSPYWISIAAWSVGAYGEGAWASAPPSSAFAGISLAVLKQASSSLDLVNVMSYDASPAFDPVQALHAYQHYFSGRIAMGIEVPPEAWGGHIETVAEIDTLANAVNASGAAGLMLWSIQKPGPAQQFATEMCSKLSLGGCNTPMF